MSKQQHIIGSKLGGKPYAALLRAPALLSRLYPALPYLALPYLPSP